RARGVEKGLGIDWPGRARVESWPDGAGAHRALDVLNQRRARADSVAVFVQSFRTEIQNRGTEQPRVRLRLARRILFGVRHSDSLAIISSGAGVSGFTLAGRS